jgi:peptidoglycan/LPS O-acetylase OafA/YrhL
MVSRAATPASLESRIPLAPAGATSRPVVRLHCLDGLRGLLACVVVACHVDETALHDFALYVPAYVAVVLFFVMSGLVLARSYDGRPFVFIIRRMVRLWPVYAVCMLAGYALIGRLPPPAGFLWWPLPPYNEFGRIDPPAWTLLLEAWATPVLLLYFRIAAFGRKWILFATLASFGLIAVDPRFFCLFFFGIGVSMAQFAIPWPQRVPRLALWLGKISYSLYLTHGLVMQVGMTEFGPKGTALVLPAVFIIAWIVWWAVERPSIAWSRAVGRKQ